MLPLLILVSGLLLALYVGRFIFRRLRLKGRGKFLSGFIAVIVGPFVFFVYVGSLANVAMLKEQGPSLSKDAVLDSQKVSSETKPADVTILDLPEEPQEEVQDESVVPLLGCDSKTFQKKFNQAAKTFKSNLRCETLKLETGAVNDSFIASVTENIALIGSIDKKTQQLQSVTMIAQGDGTMHSGANIMLGIGQLIMATAPELDAKGRGQLLKDMGLTPENLEDGKEGRHVIGNKKFFFSMSDLIGLWFGVEAVEPKGKP
ncbi:hypothetical protein [Fretibacterium fastidiosum]|uniref:Uncharacterized protein n=1 Tax=Fretibacterium fastidiosum TaxID=651822 RepID=A0AB94IXX6_9BACT|nr:hypothetical protein [Fretibacterium fastidiosum]CBL28590.1 hypothetical protein SY1_16060 [Fretibacterium fastidiosum]